MDRSRIPSPARSQGPMMTPRRPRARSTRSVGSPARSVGSGRLTSVVDEFKENNRLSSFVLSPLSKTVLSDNTEIVEPRRKSWWKKVENSRDMIEVLESNPPTNDNVIEELDVEILSQEKKHYSMDIPESSGSESIASIIIPERKLFTQKQVLQKNAYNQIVATREALPKHNKTNNALDKTQPNAGTKTLFNHAPKRSKPVFPAALLNISPDKTLANKTNELLADVRPPTKNLFGNRLQNRQKNIFTDFVVSESEDEIMDIQPKRFTFHKQPDPIRRPSSKGTREHSPTSSTTDLEMDDWKLLPSSTMVDHQLEALASSTPSRRKTRLSKLSEVKEFDGTTTVNKTKDSNKSVSSKNKSKNKTLNQSNDKDSPTKNTTQNKSKVTLSKSKNASPIKDVAHETQELKNQTRVLNKSVKNVSKNMNIETQNGIVDEIVVEENAKIQEEHEVLIAVEQNDETDDENFALEYDDKVENPVNVPNDKTRIIDVLEKHEKFTTHKTLTQEEAVTPHKNKTHNLTHKVIEESAEESDNVQDSAQDNDGIESSKQMAENDEIEQSTIVNEEEIDGELQEENESDKEQEIEVDEDDNDKEIEEEEIDEGHEEAIELCEKENESNQQEKSLAEDGQNQSEEEMEVEENDQSQIEIDEENEEVSDQQINESQIEDVEQDEEEGENEEIEDDDEIVNESILEESQDPENEEGNESGEQNESTVEEDEAIEESEVVASESEEIVEDQEDNDNEDEVDNDNEENVDVEIEDCEEIQNENEQQISETDAGTPNISHDTTGRNRKIVSKSPEVLRHNATTQDISFTAKGRNTSVRKTKSLRNMTLRRSLVPLRESNEFSYGTVDSSAEGSGWDSHRNERKTLRQTFGRDFTPRKSLRELVMEKSAKRQTIINEANIKLHEANSTEVTNDANDRMDYEDNVDGYEVSDHEVSKRTRQTTLEMYLQKIKKQNIERKLQIEQQVRNSLKSNTVRTEFFNKAPFKSSIRKPNPKTLSAPKLKRKKPTIIALEDLPAELVADLKYKPPKRFKPSNASWITKRLYRFLETKLEPRYDYKARVRAEKLVETIYAFTHDLRRVRVAPAHNVSQLEKEMARLGVVRTHYEFYDFVRDYMPSEVRFKVVPDIANNIPLPSSGVFADILLPNEEV